MSAVLQPEGPVLLREDRDGIATLTMNRPQQMNLLTNEMLDALQDAFDEISGSRNLRVVVLAATGKIQKFLLRERAKSTAAIE